MASKSKRRSQPKPCIAFDIEMNGKDILVISAAEQVVGVSPPKSITYVWHPSDMHTNRSSVLETDLIEAFAKWLDKRFSDGCTIVTWHGLHSDFSLLAHHLPHMHSKLVQIADRHVDIAFTMLCHQGFMVGLDRVAQAMVGMKKLGDSSNIPETWTLGSFADRDGVIQHVKQDARMTLNVFLEACRLRVLQWRDKHGTPHTWMIPMHHSNQGNQYMKTVRQALTLPSPSKLWRLGIRRRDCHGWTKGPECEAYADDNTPCFESIPPPPPPPAYVVPYAHTAMVTPVRFYVPQMYSPLVPPSSFKYTMTNS